MSILIWTTLALLGILLAWEAIARLRRWWPGSPADGDRHYAPEAERRREADAAASRAEHSAAVGMRNRAEPRRSF